MGKSKYRAWWLSWNSQIRECSKWGTMNTAHVLKKMLNVSADIYCMTGSVLQMPKRKQFNKILFSFGFSNWFLNYIWPLVNFVWVGFFFFLSHKTQITEQFLFFIFFTKNTQRPDSLTIWQKWSCSCGTEQDEVRKKRNTFFTPVYCCLFL